MTKREPLSEQMQLLAKEFEPLLVFLNQKPSWYGSVYLEKKSASQIAVNLKQSNVKESDTLGVVLRIYDGCTLFEAASDVSCISDKKKWVIDFAQKVLEKANPVLRPISATSWEQRRALSENNRLDKDLLTQIDLQNKNAFVHFGSSFDVHPLTLDRFGFTQDLLEKCKKAARGHVDLQFCSARLSLAKEEAVFLDEKVKMSQALLRNSLVLMCYQQGQSSVVRLGGLGGLNSVQMKERFFDEMVRDLKALQSHQLLSPGEHRVIFGPSVAGVLAHEAFGHSQEADTWARSRSKAKLLFEQKKSVGNAHATIWNNSALYSNAGESYAAWGSYYFDEEGFLAQPQVLLDQGILQLPMTNMTSALRLNIPRSANGKRESFDHGVYTRQTNTYFSPGKASLDDLLQQLDHGYLALHPAGGMEDPKGMNIQVGMSYLHEVKKGKMTGRVFKGPDHGDIQMTGFTPDVLHRIENKSKIQADTHEPDTAEAPFIDVGGCGKYHKEAVQAGCGGPYMLMNGVTLG